MVDPKTGRVRERIAHSALIADTDRPTILDPEDNLLLLNLGDGVAVMDISALPVGIASVAPSVGGAGTIITVHGTGFDGSSAVLVDGQQVSLTYQDRTTLRFAAPNHDPGPVRVIVSGTGWQRQARCRLCVQFNSRSTLNSGDGVLPSVAVFLQHPQ